MVLRFILFTLLFYLVYRILKSIFKMSFSSKKRETKDNVFNKRKQKTTIDKKDIIEAEFEEIKEKEDSKAKD